MSSVAVIRTRPRTVLDDYDRLLGMAGLEQALDPARGTILKENISWHQPFLSANTTPWQLEGTIRGLTKRGYTDLSGVANNTVVTDPYRGAELNRLEPVYRKYGIPVRYNFKPDDISWEPYEPTGRLRALDRLFPQGITLPSFFFGRNIVHLPTVKCHIYTTTTGAMKNAFGGLLNSRRHIAHSSIHEVLADLLMLQQEIHAGIFAVADGTIAGNGPGPRTMQPEEKNTILAGADQVAVDAVAARMMGFDPLTDIPYIRIAHQRGLGCGDIRQITVTGEVDIEQEQWGFSAGNNLASIVGTLFWFSPLRVFQHLLFRTPLVYLFIAASTVYHDHYWWPLVGKKRMERLSAGSDWYRLFTSY